MGGMEAFSLFARLTLDSEDFDNDLGKQKTKLQKFGDAAKKAVGTFAKIGGAALLAGGAAVGAIGKSAIEAYAEYEQLVGGVETLFKESADIVQGYAENAYKTAGLSANEYMATVTSFSASLLQSLGGDTAEAARVSDMAITDMSDNANKMGTAMESIQVAYQGFAKQNYTMLDNLKLGYGGTKSEMERLLKDAEKFSGVKYDIENLNDVYEAIHVIQTELGITGTTAKEASETISGSVSAMKSAWQNMLVGIADDNADFGKLVSNLAESAATAAKNILPRVGVALQGVGKLVEGLAPVIAEAIPTLINDVLPGLIDSAITLITTFVDTLLQNAGSLADAAISLLLKIADSIIANLPTLIPAIVSVITTIVQKLTEPDTMAQILSAAVQIIGALIEGIVTAIPDVIGAALSVVEGFLTPIVEAIGGIVQRGKELIGNFARGIGEGVSNVVRAIGNIVKSIWNGIKSAVSGAANWGRDLIDNFVGGIRAKIGAVVDAVSGVAKKVKSFLGFSEPEEGALSNFHTYAPDMMALFAKGVKDNAKKVTDEVGKVFDFEDMIKAPTPAFSGSGGIGNVTINVYPSAGMDENALADAVMDRMQTIYNRKAAAVV